MNKTNKYPLRTQLPGPAYVKTPAQTMNFSSKLKFWSERELQDSAAHLCVDALYPTVDICDSYQLEVQDKQHRRGFVLREKKQLYDHLFAQNPASTDEKWRNNFWSWLDACAGGSHIPSVQGVQESKRHLYRADFTDNRINFPVAMRGRETQEVIYVMDPRGNFFVHPKILGSAQEKAFHHSSFFSGGRVSGAGVFFLDEDHRLIRLNDWSGHYEPTAAHTYNVLLSLKRQGIDLTLVLFSRWSLPLSKTENALDWMSRYKNRNLFGARREATQ